MGSDARIVFFDLETGGLEIARPVIQAAAVVVAPGWRELETWERKIAFSEADADPEALAVNHYTAEAWKDAVPEAVAVREFAALLERHRCVQRVSARGKAYTATPIGGHNIGSFDIERVLAMFKRHGAYFAGDLAAPIDTRHGAVWALLGKKPQPENYQLGGLARHFGIEATGAHDALVDVRLSIAIARKLRELSPSQGRIRAAVEASADRAIAEAR